MTAVAREVDARAVSHLRRQLQMGRELSQRVLQVLSLDSGIVKVFASANAPESALYEFSLGGMRARGLGGRAGTDPNELLLRAISNHLRLHANALVVIEDETRQVGDRALTQFPFASVGHGQSIYHLLRAEAKPLDIQATLKLSTSAWLNIVFFSDWRFQGRETLSEDDLVGIARETQVIAVSVYDLESWMLWTRADVTGREGRRQRRSRK